MKYGKGFRELGTNPVSNPTLSACIVIDDKESGLEGLISSLSGYIDEVIVVEIAGDSHAQPLITHFTGRSYSHPWSGSVAELRNCSLRHATSEWILCLDADEHISLKHLKAIRALLKSAITSVMAVSVPIVRPSHKHYWGACWEPRLIRNRDKLEFAFPISEQVFPSVRRLGGIVTRAEFSVLASPDHPPHRYSARSRRALRILNDVHAAGDYDSIERLFAAGAAHFLLGTYGHAECYLWACSTHTCPIGPLQIHSTVLLAECYRRLGDLERSAQICTMALKQMPNDPEISSQLEEIQHAIKLGGPWQPPR